MVNLNVTTEGFMLKVKIYAADKNEFTMALAKVKNLKGARFNLAEKCWMIQNIDENNAALKLIGTIGAIPEKTKQKPAVPAVFDRCPIKYRDYAIAPENAPEIDLKARQKALIANTELNGPLVPGLRNYQVDFLRFMEARDGRAILADDMGTGKTLQSLSWLAYKDSFPAIIVVTAPTKLQWEREYKRWLNSFPKSEKVMVLNGKTPMDIPKDTTVIINWDILYYWCRELTYKKYGFKCVIGDEAQAIGNPDSKRAKAFRKIAATVPQCIVMSGTPARSKPAQYWSMISCVEPSLFPDYKAYLWRYCDPKFNPFSFEPTFDGARNTKELHAKLMKCMLRREKSEIMTELPSKQIEVVPLEVDENLRKMYDGEESAMEAIKEPSQLRLKVAALGRCAYLLKEKSLISWVNELIETTGEKVVIFCWHRDVVDLLMEGFKKYNPARIYGGMSLKEREAEKSRFINDKNCRVIVGNIQALGTGVDGLQKVCCKAVFAEFANTVTDSMQAEDRLHRGGQENPVTIYYTCAKDTIDEDMMKAMDAKRKVLDAVLNGKETQDTDLLVEILARRGIIK